jgi:glutathione synthase/RimK-type ligase-like ATP-grasp enzyme
MKKVLILFGKSDWKKSKPFANKDYQYSYEFFYTLCKKNGIQMYRASYEWYDYKKHIFKYAWIYEGENANWKRVFNVKPDLIYDKTKARMEVYYKKELIRKKYSFINNLEFTRLIDDKLTTSLLFEKWSKKSWLIENEKDLINYLPRIKSARVVLKPLIESGGKGVLILKKEEIEKKTKIKKPYLLQEFIDSSKGVPGISNRMHDLRIVFINKKIIYAYIREPKKGSFLANLAQGGSLTIVPNNKLPRSLFPIIKYVNKLFETFQPRVFCVDFMFDKKKKPWIVELNSMPGLFFTPEEKPSMVRMYNELLAIFKKKLGV